MVDEAAEAGGGEVSKLSLGVEKAVALKPDAVLVQPPEIVIPETRDELTSSMNALGGGIMLAGWATAATVYAWTEPAPRGRPSNNGEKSPLFTLSDFAALGIRGLLTRDTVRAYRSRWEDAIHEGWTKPVSRGDVVTLPSQDFTAPPPAEMAHVGQNSGENEWYTPEPYIRAAIRVMGGIDLDPASTEVANTVVGAEVFYTAEQDGLRFGWRGRVWMNPPYARPLVDQFCGKLCEEVANGNVSEAIVLVNNATETVWFQRMPEIAKAICFPSGRVKFWHPERESAPLQGQAVLYFGMRRDGVRDFCTEFAEFGFTVAVIG